MSDAVAVAVVYALGTVLAAAVTALGAVLLKLNGRVKAVQEQVANDHTNEDGTPLNLRDDLDGKHDENRDLLLKIQRDVVWLMRRQASTDDRVDALEDTARTQKENTDHDPARTPHARPAPRPRPI